MAEVAPARGTQGGSSQFMTASGDARATSCARAGAPDSFLEVSTSNVRLRELKHLDATSKYRSD